MKRVIAAGLAIAGATALSIVGISSSASAACVKSNLTTGYRGVSSTVNISSSSSCTDLNLTRSDDKSSWNWDSYAGFYYKSSTGQWVRGSRGYITTGDFNASSSSGWIVLLSAIGNGTKVGVGSENNGGDSVTVAH